MERRVDGITAVVPVDPINPKRVNPKRQKKDPRKKQSWDDAFREHLSWDEGQELPEHEESLRETPEERLVPAGHVSSWNAARRHVDVLSEDGGEISPAPGLHVDTKA